MSNAASDKAAFDKAKRLFDIVGASAALIVLSPLIAALSIMVRMKMGRPIFFRQTRPGQHGELFSMRKFRTMRSGPGTDAERMTPFGTWLRETSLDELPEFINILTGDMSIVGPRPLLPEYLPLYSAEQATRHDVRPGLTGLAQVSGRNGLSWEERLALDAEYVRDRSLLMDMRIIWRTIGAVVKRDGISADGHASMPAFSGSREP